MHVANPRKDKKLTTLHHCEKYRGRRIGVAWHRVSCAEEVAVDGRRQDLRERGEQGLGRVEYSRVKFGKRGGSGRFRCSGRRIRRGRWRAEG